MAVRKTPFILGIAGGSGCGKTYLTRSVANSVGPEHVAVLPMDQYFRSTPRESEWADVNFDHPAHLDFRLMVSHLSELRGGRRVLAPTYDFRRMEQRPDSQEVPAKPVIVVEGLFVLAEPMASLFDVTCFLDVDADQRLLGRILRDARERGAALEQIVDRYQRFVRPSYDVFVAPTKQNADIVVDFTYRRILFTALLTMLISSYVKGDLDPEGFVREMRAECNHLGFKPRDGAMPVAIDIFELAKAYPESVSAKPALSLE